MNKTMNKGLLKAIEARKMYPSKPRKPQTVEHEIRTREGHTKKLRYGRKMAVALMCTECMGWENDVEGCTSPLCPLFPFRKRTMASQR